VCLKGEGPNRGGPRKSYCKQFPPPFGGEDVRGLVPPVEKQEDREPARGDGEEPGPQSGKNIPKTGRASQKKQKTMWGVFCVHMPKKEKKKKNPQVTGPGGKPLLKGVLQQKKGLEETKKKNFQPKKRGAYILEGVGKGGGVQ